MLFEGTVWESVESSGGSHAPTPTVRHSGCSTLQNEYAYQYRGRGCLVQLGNGIELEAVGLQFVPTCWPIAVTLFLPVYYFKLKMRGDSHPQLHILKPKMFIILKKT